MGSAVLTSKRRETMNAVNYSGKTIDLDAARMLMDDKLCEAIHGTVETEQEFMNAYAAAHEAKYGTEFVFA
jgi:hypothetical protein